MKLSEFDYNLPKDYIAQYPASERDSSRLLVLSRRDGWIRHEIFKEIVNFFHPGDVLVLNNTKVIPARLYGRKTSGGKVEVLLVKELHKNKWEAIVRGLRQGNVIFKNDIRGYVIRNNGRAEIIFERDDIKSLLGEIGVMPLPPYIKRPATTLDYARYQTIYAEKNGAVAAPTAGLHFTEEVFDRLRDKGVEIKKLTLHVGYGTFKPVSSTEIEHHRMDEEYYEIPEDTADAINRARSKGRRVIAVGTTVTRALEASVDHEGRVRSGSGKAGLFIYPGYNFRVIDALITNFHLPRSTPLMLVSAFCGLGLLKKAYYEAIERRYRFYSYGDAMLII
jgi:S-adenosylmethionine:tRNA ribosyltransferase-isomerase